jgi:hypothetical protein
MRSRIKRRVVPWSVLSVLVPTVATGWLVHELVRDEEQLPLVPVRITGAPAPMARSLQPTGASATEPERLDQLQQIRRANEPQLAFAEARQLVQDPGNVASARYVALRRLESLSAADAIEEAEAAVLSAADDADGRLLAVNALAALARTPAGREALVRCVERAPTEPLRQAARVLLERQTR